MQASHRERRGHSRFEIALALRLVVLDGPKVSSSGGGTSVNISSTGIHLQTSTNVTAGDKVIAVVNWPVAAEAGSMVLLLYGQVVWQSGLNAGVVVARHCILRDLDVAAVDWEALNDDFLPKQLIALKGRQPRTEAAVSPLQDTGDADAAVPELQSAVAAE